MERSMTKNVFAYTAPGGSYPEYVSVNETDDPDQFTITVRTKPKVEAGSYLCGYPRDKGQPSRCTPGDEHCNNYCNLAPQKGKMAAHPASCEHTNEGATAIIALTMVQMAELSGAIHRAITGTSV
jgi:hypothetical protein